MRIIGGKYQRRHIIAPSKLPVRPTTDMAKEALFSIINNQFDFENISVLDLFAGTGNISYEFASRGTPEVIAVDMNNHCVQFIKKTAEIFGMENLRAVRAEAFHFLSFCKVSFDIVFADPPYDLKGIPEIPVKVFEANVVKPGGMLVLEHGDNINFSGHPFFVEKRKYGKVHFSFFKPKE
ncbi:MAG: methyltransferase domain-containing protein [Bacteroidetes bacterium]|nr:MAG: methyltransferase domain-containing protein [Bacteroidota bacterium]